MGIWGRMMSLLEAIGKYGGNAQREKTMNGKQESRAERAETGALVAEVS
jgi:hypothetical protein